MFTIKICGITSPADAAAAAEAGADAIGLNFYSASPRRLTMQTAAEISRATPASVARVGVFVNAAADEMLRAVEAAHLDWIQLHGDEPADVAIALRERLVETKIAKAFRIDDAGPVTAAAYLERCQLAALLPDAVLVDAHRPGQYGGTGATLDWSPLRPPRTWTKGLPLILAGGLTPRNVSEAIDQCRPAAVDAASGVEYAPGKKDVMLMKTFITRAKAALAAAERSPNESP